MDRKPVESSNLRSVGYDHKQKKLEIEFKTSGVYTYDGVPKRTHTNLMDAGSKGKYHHKWIKERFPFKRS